VNIELCVFHPFFFLFTYIRVYMSNSCGAHVEYFVFSQVSPVVPKDMFPRVVAHLKRSKNADRDIALAEAYARSNDDGSSSWNRVSSFTSPVLKADESARQSCWFNKHYGFCRGDDGGIRFVLENLSHHSKMLSDYEVKMLRDFKHSSNKLVMRRTLQDMGV
jgi:hypothetical protein